MTNDRGIPLATGLRRFTLGQLMGMAEEMSDWVIAHDFDDCVVALARKDPKAVETLEAYARARTSAPGFDGHRVPSKARPSKNNHEAINLL